MNPGGGEGGLIGGEGEGGDFVSGRRRSEVGGGNGKDRSRGREGEGVKTEKGRRRGEEGEGKEKG